MTTITLRARGSAPVDVAWERYARPRLWSTWSPQITSVRVDADRIAAGVRGTVYGHLGLRVEFVISAVDEAARTWAWRVGLGPLRMTPHHAVTADAGGSATSLTVTGPAPIVVGYLVPARLALSRLVRP